MNRILVFYSLLMLVFINESIYSQTTSFVNAYLSANQSELIYDAFETDSGYFLVGTASAVNENNFYPTVYKLNKEGILIEQKNDTTGLTKYTNLIKFFGHLWVVSFTWDTANNIFDSLVFLKIDDNFNIIDNIKIKLFQNTISPNIINYYVDNHTLHIYGVHGEIGSWDKFLYFTSIDTNFQVVDSNLFIRPDSLNNNYVSNMVKIAGHAGFFALSSSYPSTKPWRIIKIENEIPTIHLDTFQSPILETMNLISKDSVIVTIGRDPYCFDYHSYLLAFRYLSFDTITVHRLGNEFEDAYITSTNSLALAGNNLFVGYSENINPFNLAMSSIPTNLVIGKYDMATGNLLNTFKYCDSTYTVITKLISTSDGGCLAVTTQYKYLENDNQIDVKVLKLNSLGNLAWVNTVSTVKKKFMVYPNPAGNFVTLQLDEGQVVEQVEVISMEGKTVLSSKPTGANNVNVETLAPGNYIIKATTRTKDVLKGRLVKQ